MRRLAVPCARGRPIDRYKCVSPGAYAGNARNERTATSSSTRRAQDVPEEGIRWVLGMPRSNRHRRLRDGYAGRNAHVDDFNRGNVLKIIQMRQLAFYHFVDIIGL